MIVVFNMTTTKAQASQRFLPAVVLFGTLMMAVHAEAESPRLRYTINEGWRFHGGIAADAHQPGFDDGSWQRISLPHTWNASDSLDKNVQYRRGTGWYRRTLTLDPSLRGRRLFLHFEGANQVADVFVNGRKAGSHIGGYTAFVFDITSLVRLGEENLIAVRVDNAHEPAIPPLNGDFTFFGGIYRDVWLVATSPVHITLEDHASPGVFISTPEVSAARGVVRIRGTVVNRGDQQARIRVTNRILAPSGEEIAAVNTDLEVASEGSSQFEVVRGIARPLLWSPASPNLYRVITEILDCGPQTSCDGALPIDAVDNPLGFRWFSADAEKGFLLNGKPMKLYGTNRHQDFPGYGNAVPDGIHRRDVGIVKETGFNFLRLAHYPQDPAVLEEADRIGVVIWEEIPVVNLITPSQQFFENSERMLVEMIRQHYNHPSIVFWGTLNEVLLIKPDPIPEGYYQSVRELTLRLDALARREDPTRLTALALSRDEINNDYGLGDIPDVLGLNLYFGWYYDTFATLGEFLDDLHAKRPTRPIIVSEYGADTDERVHAREPVAFDFSSEHGQNFHVVSFPQLASRPYVIGTGVWNQFDFGSAGRQDTKYGLNQKGLFFHDRTPKDTAFYYRAALRDEPLVYIAREWSVRAGSRSEDRMQPVWVYSNEPEVALYVNGRAAGSQKVQNRTARWNVELRHGSNEIVAKGPRTEDRIRIEYSDRTGGDFFAVNAGAHYSYTDEAGTVWEADRPYVSGSWGYVGGESSRTHHRIFDSVGDPLYQASREGMERYRFDVPDGTWRVTLGFAEGRRETAARERVFSVHVNGQEVFTDLDLASRFGAYTAVDRSVLVDAVEGDGIRIEFVPKKGKASIASIMVQR